VLTPSHALEDHRAMRWTPLAAAAFGIVALAPLGAHATDFEVSADTALSGYQVASPWGDVIVDRRRFTQTVGLGLYNLQGRYRPGEADFRAVVMARLDADFGINARLPRSQAGGETTYATASGPGVRFIPGLQQAPVDLIYAYVEGRNIAHGLLGFRLGRQLMTDVLGWWSFDGGLLRLTTPFYVQVEAYGGLEQRGGMPLSTSRYERQGVWRGSHSGFASGTGTPSVVDYPSYLYTEPAPAFGFAAETTGPSFLHARISYRRVYNTSTALTSQFPDPNGGGYRQIDGIRVSQDRVGASANIGKAGLGYAKGGFTYDLVSQIVASFYGGLEAQLGKRATIGADVDYFVPTFDADSIWNWFTHGPITTLTGRAAVRFTKRFDIAASGGARIWTAYGDPSRDERSGLSGFGAGACAAAEAQLKAVGGALDCTLGRVYLDPSSDAVSAYAKDPANRAASRTVDALANFSGRYHYGLADVSLRGMLEAGARGTREGADLSGEARLDGGRYILGTRVSLYGWSDPTRPERDAVSFGYVLSAGFKPAEVARLRLEWEHDTNRLVGQRYRVLGLVSLRLSK
jgi:hypothetical protein